MELVQKQVLSSHDDKVWTVAWHHSGKFLATGSSDKLIKIWGAGQSEDPDANLAHQSTLDGAHTRTVRSLAWKPGCEVGSLVLASSSFDATACLWMQDGGDFEPHQTLEGHENEVKCVAWSPEGNYVATCSRDKTIWIFEEDGDEGLEFECMGVLSGHSQDVKFVKWHPQRDQLFSASYDDTIKAWSYENSVDEWVCKYTIRGHTSTVWALDFDPSGQYLVSCSEDKTWSIWSVSETGYKKLCKVSDTHFRAIYSVSWSPKLSAEGKHRIATVGSDNQLFVHEVDQTELDNANEQPPVDEASGLGYLVTPQLVAKVSLAHDSDVNAVQFNPVDAGKLASVSDDGTLKIWQVRPRENDAEMAE